MRLFVAVDLPETLSEDIRAAQARFDGAAGLRFTDPEQAHVTIQFLGEVDSETREPIESALEAAVSGDDIAPFEASVGGFGVFPSLEYISVVWTGIRQGAGELTRLNAIVEEHLAPLGFEGDDHAFTPHVTLARMDDARGKETVQRVVREEDPTVGTFEVRELLLKKSELSPEGPDYSTLARFPL